MIYPDLDINGMKTETDVCDMICDTIDDGNLSDAMDYVGQFKDYLTKGNSYYIILLKIIKGYLTKGNLYMKYKEKNNIV